MATSILPNFKYTVPTLLHVKERPYIDFPLVYNETVTQRPFYVENEFTICTSDLANTTLYKWTGGGWADVGIAYAVEPIALRGFFSVTTAANAYVSITEHVQEI